MLRGTTEAAGPRLPASCCCAVLCYALVMLLFLPGPSLVAPGCQADHGMQVKHGAPAVTPSPRVQSGGFGHCLHVRCERPVGSPAIPLVCCRGTLRLFCRSAYPIIAFTAGVPPLTCIQIWQGSSRLVQLLPTAQDARAVAARCHAG